MLKNLERNSLIFWINKKGFGNSKTFSYICMINKLFNFKRNKMKTFKDLDFNPHPNHPNGVQARITFNNGYGASVVKSEYSYGGSDGLYELAVFGKDGHISYDTPITNDVLGYLKAEEVTKILEQIQLLK